VQGGGVHQRRNSTQYIDTEGLELSPHGFTEVEAEALAGGIDAGAGLAADGLAGTHQQQAAATAFNHRLHKDMTGVHGVVDIHIDQVVPGVQISFREQLACGVGTGIGHKQAHFEIGNGFAQLNTGVGQAEIQYHHPGFYPVGFFQGFAEGGEDAVATRDQHTVNAGSGDLVGELLAGTVGGAGNHCPGAILGAKGGGVINQWCRHGKSRLLCVGKSG